MLLQTARTILLHNATEGYCKMPQIVYCKMLQFSYIMRQLLQNATILLQNAAVMWRLLQIETLQTSSKLLDESLTYKSRINLQMEYLCVINVYVILIKISTNCFI